MAKEIYKGKPTSIRLYPETEEYLMRCEGKTLTDKFEYLVHFCMKREEALIKMEKEYRHRYEVYEEAMKKCRELFEKSAEELTTILTTVEDELNI